MATINLGKVVPTKGTDYFTNADKSEIQTVVETAIAPTLATMEVSSNKVTSIGDSSTDTQYPSAKATYDLLQAKDALITELEEQNEIILNQIPTATATGETIHVTDSAKLPLANVEVLGNATQQTSTGKNLFDKDNATYSTGHKIKDASGNEITSGASSYTTSYVSVEPNTTYTIQGNLVSTGTQSWALYYYDTNKGWIEKVEASGTNTLPKTFTTPNNCYYLQFQFIQSSFNPDTAMIELGSSASPYEPFTNGQASPSPSLPQNINVVTGENTISIQSKNLLLQTGSSTTISNVTITKNNDGSISLSGTANADIYYYLIGSTSNHPLNLKAGTYTLSGGISSNIFLRLFSNGIAQDNTTTPKTFTLNYEDGFSCYLRIKNGAATNVTIYPMLELNSNVTNYEPYAMQTFPLNLGDIELAKIGDYADRIYKDNGKWYVYKAIGKASITSSSSITYSSQYDFFQVGITPKGVVNADALSKIALPMTATGQFKIKISNNGIYAWYFGATATFEGDIDAFKEVLDNINGDTVFYPLQASTTTEITDQALLTALEQVEAMTTYKTKTNAFTLTVSDNATPTLVMEYRQDIETLINNLDARLSLLE